MKGDRRINHLDLLIHTQEAMTPGVHRELERRLGKPVTDSWYRRVEDLDLRREDRT